MKKLSIVVVCAISISVFAQSNDESTIRLIFDEALERGESYKNLEHLTTKIGGRLSGSPAAAQAVVWTKMLMEKYGFDAVWLQPVMVPHWVRGQKEVGNIRLSNGQSLNVNVCALGNAVGTGPGGVLAENN
jgi:hypothetical protein